MIQPSWKKLEAIANARTTEEFTKAQARLLVHDEDNKQELVIVSNFLGLPRQSASRLLGDWTPTKTARKEMRGGRRTGLLYPQEEGAFLTDWLEQQADRPVTNLSDLKAKLESHLSRPVHLSFVTRMVRRNGWQKGHVGKNGEKRTEWRPPANRVTGGALDKCPSPPQVHDALSSSYDPLLHDSQFEVSGQTDISDNSAHQCKVQIRLCWCCDVFKMKPALKAAQIANSVPPHATPSARLSLLKTAQAVMLIDGFKRNPEDACYVLGVGRRTLINLLNTGRREFIHGWPSGTSWEAPSKPEPKSASDPVKKIQDNARFGKRRAVPKKQKLAGAKASAFDPTDELGNRLNNELTKWINNVLARNNSESRQAQKKNIRWYGCFNRRFHKPTCTRCGWEGRCNRLNFAMHYANRKKSEPVAQLLRKIDIPTNRAYEWMHILKDHGVDYLLRLGRTAKCHRSSFKLLQGGEDADKAFAKRIEMGKWKSASATKEWLRSKYGIEVSLSTVYSYRAYFQDKLKKEKRQDRQNKKRATSSMLGS